MRFFFSNEKKRFKSGGEKVLIKVKKSVILLALITGKWVSNREGV